MITRRKKIFSFLVMSLLLLGVAVGFYARRQDVTEQMQFLPDSLVFRSAGGTETSYLVFQTNGTYSLILRMHMGTWEFDHGSWSQSEPGEMTLTSHARTNFVSHVRALKYKSKVTLVSPDHNLIRIRASSIQEVQRKYDDTETGKTPWGLFVQINAERAIEEAGSPQPFIFYPELNKPRHHVFELQKGSPLTPNHASEATSAPAQSAAPSSPQD